MISKSTGKLHKQQKWEVGSNCDGSSECRVLSRNSRPAASWDAASSPQPELQPCTCPGAWVKEELWKALSNRTAGVSCKTWMNHGRQRNCQVLTDFWPASQKHVCSCGLGSLQLEEHGLRKARGRFP